MGAKLAEIGEFIVVNFKHHRATAMQARRRLALAGLAGTKLNVEAVGDAMDEAGAKAKTATVARQELAEQADRAAARQRAARHALQPMAGGAW